MRVLIAGCGYVGLALGARLRALGHQVSGFRRPGGNVTPLTSFGIEPIAADLTRPATLAALGGIAPDWLIFCAAPGERTESAYRSLYLDGIRNLLHALRNPPPRAFVFIGSTGVYAQTDGSLVDESAPTEPVDFGGRVLLEAEAELSLAVRAGWPGVVLRAAGIYGPGRNRISSVRSRDARLIGDGSRRLNFIHRDDLVSAILVALERIPAGSICNVGDGVHPTEREFLGWLAGRLGVPIPPAGATATPERRARPFTNKRVVAERLRREFGWRPVFPDFRAGHEAILAAEAATADAGLRTTVARQGPDLPPP